MTKELDIFYAFLEDYADFMEGLSDQEDGKYAALLSFDAHKVDHVISEQQAALMRLDAMKKQREKLQEEAGLGGCSFREIVRRADEEDRDYLHALLMRIESAVMDIRFRNAKSTSFARDSLRAFSQNADSPERKVTGGYTSEKKVVEGPGSPLFETKI